MAERPEISESFDPIAALLRLRALSAPARPGLLAQLDRWEIMSVLGGGRTGVVLLARDPRDDARAAIKLLRAELASDSGARHRFAVAARHMQALAHPAIVPALEFADRPEGPYVVMPFFPGGSLARRLEENRPLPTGFTRRTTARIAAALQHAHGKGLLHGGLTPANILLAADGEAAVADLGMSPAAHTAGAAGTTADCSAQTAAYISPALARGEVEDTRRDIYACGAILYHMLTGQPPYRGETPAAVLEQIRTDPPPPVLQLNPEADRALARIAQRAMARNLHDRYRDMGEMLADLDRIGHTRMAGLLMTRRGQLRVAAAGAVTLALALLGLATWFRSQTHAIGTRAELLSPPFSTSYGQPLVFPELAPVPNMAVDVTIPPGGYDVEIAIIAADEATSAFTLAKLTRHESPKGSVEFAIERVDRRGDVKRLFPQRPFGPVEMATQIPLPLRFAADRDVPPGDYQYRLLARTRFGNVAAANVRLSVAPVHAAY